MAGKSIQVSPIHIGSEQQEGQCAQDFVLSRPPLQSIPHFSEPKDEGHTSWNACQCHPHHQVLQLAQQERIS